MSNVIGNASIDYVNSRTGVITSGGNISLSTSTTAGSFVTFASQACVQLTIANNTGTTLEVQQAGTGVALPIFPASYYTFYGITDASQLGVRRVDQSTTSVTVTARWES